MKIDVWKVRELIATRQMKMSDMADAANLSSTNLAKVLHRGTCRLSTGGRIAAALGVNIREIWIEE